MGDYSLRVQPPPTTAAPSINKEGATIGEGKEKQRLKLDEDPRFQVATRTIQEEGKSGLFVIGHGVA